jgi:polyphosphate glucokinase
MSAPPAGTDEYPAVPAPSARLTGRALGIDIGGTGIKAGVVDLATGRLVTGRVREPTPQPATVDSMLDVVVDLVRRLEATGKLTPAMPGGVGFPSVMRAGRAFTATQLDPSWIGSDVRALFERRLGRRLVVLADTDAAGVAELAYGAGRREHGVVLMLNLGTGIGSALLMNGQLVPNMQFGHVEFHGHDAETRLSRAARKRRRLAWRTTSGRT